MRVELLSCCHRSHASRVACFAILSLFKFASDLLLSAQRPQILPLLHHWNLLYFLLSHPTEKITYVHCTQFLRVPALQSIRICAPEVKPLSWPLPSEEQQDLPALTYPSVCIPPLRSSGLVNASVIIGTALWSVASCHHCLITSFTTTMLCHWTREVLLFSCQKWRGRTEKTERRAAMMIKGMKWIFCQEKQRCGASIWKRNNLGRIWPRSTKPYMACSLALPNQEVGYSKWIRGRLGNRWKKVVLYLKDMFIDVY